MQILEAAENYLEAILMEGKKRGVVRSIDISHAMGHSRPTVSVMMKQLRENGYIQMDDAGLITLSETGKEIASRIYERHMILAGTLMALGVEEETAFQDACKIEHDLSEDSFDKIKQHYQAMKF